MPLQQKKNKKQRGGLNTSTKKQKDQMTYHSVFRYGLEVTDKKRTAKKI